MNRSLNLIYLVLILRHIRKYAGTLISNIIKGLIKMNEQINFCGFCGVELPPYELWHWCLCPACEVN